jgi:threonine/homoserine/homoserine lactone efflux protein
MSASSMLLFAVAFSVACVSPGPAITAVVARVLGRGASSAPMLCCGLLIGDLVWLSCAVFGVAAIAQNLQPLFLVIKYLGVAYLLYLAWKLWTTPVGSSELRVPNSVEGVRSIFAGLSIALGNPKTMLFYVALLPSLVPVASLTVVDLATLAATVIVIYSLVLTGYVLLAAQARKLFRSPRQQRAVNRASGSLMAGTAAVIACR